MLAFVLGVSIAQASYQYQPLIRRVSALHASDVGAIADELHVEEQQKDEEKEKDFLKETAGVSSGQAIQSQGQTGMKKKCEQHRPKALFCYALVGRTPLESTAALLAKQLSAACDGWKLFGHTDDPAKNVTKAFSKRDFYKGWQPLHGMRETVTNGVWKYLVNSGALDEYEWFLKVDSDTFVRPSTLRKSFRALHSSCVCGACTQAYSVANDDFDGFFVALQADLVLKIQALGWPKSCDIVLAGQDGFQAECAAFAGTHVGPLRDSQGHTLVSMDNGPEVEITPSNLECENVANIWLQRARSKIKGPLCACTPDSTTDSGSQPACVGEDFVSIHHVKDASTYTKLIEAFP